MKQLLWKFGKRNTFIYISHFEHQSGNNSKSWILIQWLKPTVSDHHFWPVFTMLFEKWTITKQPPHGYFIADPSYYAIIGWCQLLPSKRILGWVFLEWEGFVGVLFCFFLMETGSIWTLTLWLNGSNLIVSSVLLDFFCSEWLYKNASKSDVNEEMFAIFGLLTQANIFW